MHTLLVVGQLVAVIGAIQLPAFERQIHGSLGYLLPLIGINFNKDVSLASLPAMTARKGGLTYIMAATFTFFIIVAPILRALSLHLIRRPRRPLWNAKVSTAGRGV